jgi:hypothetical protein
VFSFGRVVAAAARPFNTTGANCAGRAWLSRPARSAGVAATRERLKYRDTSWPMPDGGWGGADGIGAPGGGLVCGGDWFGGCARDFGFRKATITRLVTISRASPPKAKRSTPTLVPFCVRWLPLTFTHDEYASRRGYLGIECRRAFGYCMACDRWWRDLLPAESRNNALKTRVGGSCMSPSLRKGADCGRRPVI